MRAALALLLALALNGCGDDGGPGMDAGGSDSGRDAAGMDAGRDAGADGGRDGATDDAGSDGGGTDAAPDDGGAPDAAPDDGGAPDAEPPDGGGTCDPQEARGMGFCEIFFGYAWNGTDCVGISGCSCTGADCDSLYEVPGDCLADHAGCFPSCSAAMSCADTDWCDYTDGSCGRGGETGRCLARPDACVGGPFGRTVCGCDGVTYMNECLAQAAGTDVEREGACGEPLCDPMEARGVGACAAIIGYLWSGRRCYSISGCSCEGADCGRLFPTMEECDAAFAGCMTDCRTTGCPEGQYCSFCFVDWVCIPEGAVC